MKSYMLLVFLLVIPLFTVTAQYSSLEKIEALEDSLITQFPDIIKKEIIGKSVLGKNITALKISDNVNTDEDEPEVLFEGCIHGDETFPEQTMSLLAKDLCLQYKANNQKIKDLIDNREIWIIPVVNPDGLEGHQYGHRPNSNGIDLNRNFGYMWNHEDFDTIPYSEPETKLLRDFILERNFSILTDYHAGLAGIIYPWFYRKDKCPDYNEIFYLADNYLKVSGYSQEDFNVTSGFGLYQTFGSVSEFAYGSLGISAYGVELWDFHNSTFISGKNAYNLNKNAILMFIEKAGLGLNGKVTDASTGKPILANIQVDNRVPIYSSQNLGDFHKFLLPDTYNLTVNANGYISKTIENITVKENQPVYLNIELQPKTENQFISKLIACRNFGNTIDDAKTWYILNGPDNKTYALGDSGWVIVDMGNEFANIEGNDFTVYGNGSVNDNYFVWVSTSIDNNWTLLGKGRSTHSFDLQSVEKVRYIKVVDDGSGNGNVKGAGFNLDAIQILSTPVTDIATNNPYNLNSFNLYQNYPNPFNPTTTISYSIPAVKKLNATSQHVLLKVYDILGREIATLVNKNQFPGNYKVQFNASNLNSGVYFYRISAGNYTEVKKMILTK